MQIKLTRLEIESLVDFVFDVIETSEATTLESKLTLAILKRFYEKLAKAYVVVQKKYSVKMDDITAIAFWMEFRNWPLTPTDFTDNLVLKLSNQIQQHYA